MATPSAFLDRLGSRVEGHRGAHRFSLDRDGWYAMIEALGQEGWTLVGEWAEPGRVHACLRDGASGDVAVASLDCPEGRFPSLSQMRPAAIRFERAIKDLHGLNVEALIDPRPWLDHDSWPVRAPLAAEPLPALPFDEPYVFLPAEGPGLHRIPVGPIHAGVGEPGHFRFTVNGETIVRLEERFGYAHKGTEALMQGRSVADAARLAARISGDSTVAHSLAFAMAVETATGCAVPARAVHLRALMAELERIANHLGDIGAVCDEAGFAFLYAECGILREHVLRISDACFGHRLMMDRVIPGGVAVDLPSGPEREDIAALIEELRRCFPSVAAAYVSTPSLRDRTVGIGRVSKELATRFGAGGFVGRASGLGHDARRTPGYPPYDGFEFAVPVFGDGDADARVRVRIHEVEQSLALIGRILEELPGGPLSAGIPAIAGEGVAFVESFRGEIMTWVRIGEDGTVLRCHPRDPSWLQWPLLEAAVEGNTIGDFPLCKASFNCSCSGHDL